jgi:hypothetical protein
MRINLPVLNVWSVEKNGKVYITATRNDAALPVDRIVLDGLKDAENIDQEIWRRGGEAWAW